MYPSTIIKCNLLTLALAIILLLHLLLATQTFRYRAKVTQNNLRVKDRERVIALSCPSLVSRHYYFYYTYYSQPRHLDAENPIKLQEYHEEHLDYNGI